MKHVFIFLVLFSVTLNSQNQTPPKNVLFVMVDDLRPELSLYGQNQIISPNIDALGASGVTFNRAYCNVPVCGASRASLLTGVRPTANRFLTYHSRIKEDMPDVVNMVQYFKDRGYSTVSNNKITHIKNDIDAWDEEWYPKAKTWRNYLSEENLTLEAANKAGHAYENIDVPDAAYIDGQTALKSIEDLKKFKEDGAPFFLAVGFVKPHLPFNAPKKYWDLYDPNAITLPEHATFPESAPQNAKHNWGELRSYIDIPKTGPLTEAMAKKLIHGYYASVSYVDAQIGVLINSLTELGLRENTVIVLVGDHGWSLSEHGLWVKHSNFEVALQVPLIISDSRLSNAAHTNSIAELVDLYPTLCELTAGESPTHLQGSSLVSALKSPATIFKNSALARWKKGETLIMDQLFYTEWKRNNKVVSKMLYNHKTDPDETINLANDPDYLSIVKALSQQLEQFKTTFN
ncbi:MAG: sulfatase [Flavobacteriaceae bacterium]|jgi:iduronate 2-sulfatase|nr:sulfatase [Flavobacteriaceae bacterium]